MRCPKCGNEVNQDESFCGQCGTPTSQLALPNPTEMVYTPPRSGLLSSYQPNNTNMPPHPAAPSNAYNTGVVPPPNTYGPHPGGTAAPNQPAVGPINPEQQSGFYQDATEAMSVMPGSGYPQQGFAGYPGTGQFGSQVQPGSYTQHGGFTQVPQFPGGQAYGYGVQPNPTPPPPKKPQAHAGIVIASVCLGVALIAVVIFGILYLTKGRSSPQVSTTPTPVATTAPSPTATPIPSPTATATPIPSPTVPPTPAPDANFTWCGATCSADGFIVEYPTGWNESQTTDKTGVEFLNPAQQDQYAAFKLPPTPANSNASQLVDADLQNTFSGQPGYTPPTSKQVTTIGGETWTYAVAYYLLNGQQKERVEVFATIHAGKGYVIELQAADSQFDAVNTQYFAIMIGRFQFQQSAS